MTIEKLIESKTKTMTDLSGKKTKVLYLKDENEIEDFKQQLLIHSVVKSFYCYDETVQIAEETGDKIIRCDKQCEKCKQ